MTGNILELNIDDQINAIFIRSGLKVGVLEKLLNDNPHINTLVYCEIPFSSDGSEGIEILFNKYEKIEIQRSNCFVLNSVSNLQFNSGNYSYVFHVFTR